MGSRVICSQVCDRRNPKISFLKPYAGGGSKPDRTCREGSSGGRRLIDESHSQVIKYRCFGSVYNWLYTNCVQQLFAVLQQPIVECHSQVVKFVMLWAGVQLVPSKHHQPQMKMLTAGVYFLNTSHLLLWKLNNWLLVFNDLNQLYFRFLCRSSNTDKFFEHQS